DVIVRRPVYVPGLVTHPGWMLTWSGVGVDAFNGAANSHWHGESAAKIAPYWITVVPSVLVIEMVREMFAPWSVVASTPNPCGRLMFRSGVVATNRVTGTSNVVLPAGPA